MNDANKNVNDEIKDDGYTKKKSHKIHSLRIYFVYLHNEIERFPQAELMLSI